MATAGDSKSVSEESLAGSTAAGGAAESGSAYRLTGAETQSDIGQAESRTHGVGVDADLWSVNRKLVFGQELSHADVKRTFSESTMADSQRMRRNGEDADQTRRGQHERAVEEALALQTRLNAAHVDFVRQVNARFVSEGERTIRVGDVASENMWTVDRAALEAAVAAAVGTALAEMRNKQS